MKLVTYTYQNGTYLGYLIDASVVNFAEAVAQHRPGAPAPTDMLSLLQSDEKSWEQAKATAEWVANSATVERIPLENVKLEAPISNPSKIICVGQNYYDHCREQNVPIPERPILFSKFTTCIIGTGDTVQWKEGTTEQADYEAELTLVVKKKARHIAKENAYEYLAGYTIANDVSARDVQFGDKQWVRGKSFDTFCPIGPYIATTDEIPDPHTLSIKTRVNGETLQDSSTSQMIFKVPDLIEFITRTITLLPGDIIITGTPDGVGVFRKPPIFLKNGDAVEIEIDGLGLLQNSVKVI